MSDGILTPGERPGPWQTLGDHHKRIRALEAVPVIQTEPEGDTFQDLILAQPDLFAYWPMGEASGTLIDLGPHGIDMPNSFVGGPIIYGVAGPFPGRTACNLNNGYFETTISGALANQIFGDPSAGVKHPYTIIGCALMPSTADANDGVFYANAASDAFVTYFSSVFGANGLGAQRASDIADFAPMAIGEWMLIVHRYDGVTIELIVNGATIATEPGNDSVGSSGTAPLSIGGIGDPVAAASKAHVSDVALFTDAISDSLVEQLTDVFLAGGNIIEEGTVPVADGVGGYDWLFPIEVTY